MRDWDVLPLWRIPSPLFCSFGLPNGRTRRGSGIHSGWVVSNFLHFFWTYVDVAASNCVNTIWLLSSSNVFREEMGWRWFILQFFMVESKSERVDILSHTGCYLDFRHEGFNSMKVSTAIGFNPMKELLLWKDHQLDFAVYSSSGCVYMFPASGSPRPPPWYGPPLPRTPVPRSTRSNTSSTTSTSTP